MLQATSQKKRLACSTSRIVITDLTSKETYSLNTFKVCLPVRISITNLPCERFRPLQRIDVKSEKDLKGKDCLSLYERSPVKCFSYDKNQQLF